MVIHSKLKYTATSVSPTTDGMEALKSQRESCPSPRSCSWAGNISRHRTGLIFPRSETHAISNDQFCGREKFSKISVENRTQYHAPQHADAPHSCRGPLKVVSKLRTTCGHGFWRDLTRFRTKILRPRKFFQNFGRKSAENRTISDAPQHADAPHTCSGPLRVLSKLRTTWRHGRWRDLMRFRT